AIALLNQHPRPQLAEAGGGGEKETRSFLAQMIPPPPEAVQGTGAPGSVQELVDRLPLERKVAQLFLIGFDGTDDTAPVFATLKRTDYGGVVLGRQNYTDPAQVAALADGISATAQKVRHVSPFVMAVQEGGGDSAFPDLPPAEPAAKVGSPAKAGKQALASGKALKAVGVNGVLGPVLDIGTTGSPVEARAYSDSPDEVVAYAQTTAEGYQKAGIIAAPEHFPGLGAANQSPAVGPASVGLTLAELEHRDVLPFAAAAQAEVPAMVIGNASYVTDDFVTPASQSRALIEGVLRKRLGYTGLAIADDLSTPAVTAVQSVPDAAIESIRAGADMVYISGTRGDQEAAYLAVLNSARRGEISSTRLNQAALRVLTAKERAGLIR
ncbi:MAG: beta-N-acetylhexosaminidase, partial [Thermoleophilaceae bacterium]|nr:beta-N-acetylhexosaminidase [Thermoleophilaceae bacterium]